MRTHFGLRYLPYVTDEQRQAWEVVSDKSHTTIDPLHSVVRQSQMELTNKHVERRLGQLPADLHDELRKMLDTPRGDHNDFQKELATTHEKMCHINVDMLKEFDAEFKELSDRTDTNISSMEAKQCPPQIRAL